MGQHHAFGVPVAPDVDDSRRIARRGTGAGAVASGCRGGLLDGLVAKQFVDLEETPAPWHEATLGEKFHHRVDQIGSADDQFGAHVLDHVCDLGGCRRQLGIDSTRPARGTALSASATVGWLVASTATRPVATESATLAASANEARFHSVKVQLRSPHASAGVSGAA